MRLVMCIGVGKEIGLVEGNKLVLEALEILESWAEHRGEVGL